jgi:DivIVA domain-containing protein
MPEERLTISSSARVHPDEVARHTFGTTRRGFDPAEVRAFLEHVARELVAGNDREQELHRAVAEAERRAANPVLDEATLTASLGLETGRVLRSAHEAAADLVARAEADATRVRADAQEAAEQLQRHTEQSAHDRRAEVDAVVSELQRRANEEATARVESAKLEAEALVSQTRAECRNMVLEAQELRTRVLTDLARRRRVLHSQIEQLRAGRERLAETIGDVRHAVDDIAENLFRAEDEARLAAEAAGRNAVQEELPDVATLETPTETGAPIGDATAPEADEPDTRQSVEELFARLRAEASVLAPSDDTAVAVAIIEVPDETGEGSGAGPASADRPARADPSEGPVAGAETPTAEMSVVGSDPTDEPGHERDPIVVRRDEVLTPLVATLARRLKRALQDDQNDILDRLRAKGGWAPRVLPSESDHSERYVRAAADQLLEAARAGATFAGGKADEAPGVDDVAAALASDIVAPLRRRLEGEGPSVQEGDESALVELVGAAFREWKGARTERLAGDQAVFAFARAALSAVPEGTGLRWVVDDDVAECPDCDDNALAGPVPSGDSFPTGHPHPPAHAGCRCLLAPATA